MSTEQPLKSEKCRVRVAISGGRIEHDGNTTAFQDNLTTMKLHLNRTIITPGSRRATLDMKDLCCGTPMEQRDCEHA